MAEESRKPALTDWPDITIYHSKFTPGDKE